MKTLNLKSVFAPIAFYTKRLAAFMSNLDDNLMIKTVKVTIGGVGVSGCNYNFATAANYTEQIIDFGHVLPAMCKIIDVTSLTDTAFTACTTLVAEVGISSSGNECVASATIKAQGAITTLAHAGALNNAPVNAAGHIFVSATPDSGTTWAAITAGKVSYYITYLDLAGQD